MQRARDEGVTRAVAAAVSRFQQSHPETTISEPSDGWLAAVRSATRSNIDWFDCRVHLQQLAERQLASGQVTATEYFTSDLIEQGVTGPTFVGVPAADIARASVIWAGAEVEHRIEALRSKDAIATTTQSALTEQSAPPDSTYPQPDTAMTQTDPTEPGNAIQELAQQVSREAMARDLARLGGSYQVTANDLECMRAAGINVTERSGADASDAKGG